MAQRRNSSGKGGDQSGLFDVKALAAKARSETGGPVARPNPAELSGVRPRRESVVGIRVTPPQRAASSELPNWLWGVLGCLSVLLIGFAALFFLGRSGKLGALVGDAVALSPAAAPPPATEPVVIAEPSPKEPEAPARPEHAARAEHAGRNHAPAREAEAPAAAPAPEVPAVAQAPAEPAPAEPAAPAAAATADDGTPAKRPGRPAGAKRGAKSGDAPSGADDESSAAKAAAAEADDGDDSAPGQDDVERALDALAPKVRGCFVKYQIKGTARVRLVATPAGKAESVNVTGDFEDTPTGLCVESILSEAKLPSFKGAALKLSQSYQLR